MGSKLNIVELTDTRLLSSSFKIEDSEMARNGGSLEFSCEVQLIETEKNEVIQLIATLKVHGFNEDKTLFNINGEYISDYNIYDVDAFNTFPEQERVELCLSLMFSIIREDTMAILSRAGLRQITIPYHFNAPELV
ncbi:MULTISPECIES: hypothetical protein [unclassified Vibrio]|uniref:hypothetical protein n=1 Tax=unclassified Vibrio TaxID=2614977 RepID=UPI00354FE0DB